MNEDECANCDHHERDHMLPSGELSFCQLGPCRCEEFVPYEEEFEDDDE